MTMNQSRYGLVAVFGAGLILQLGGFFLARRRMWPEDFNGLLVKLLEVYSAQFGLVLGGIFAQTKARMSHASSGLCWTALILASLWNLLLVAGSLAFCFAQQDSATDLMKYFDTIGSGSAFLVAGVIAFFFGKA
jgi:hypothetical protein